MLRISFGRKERLLKFLDSKCQGGFTLVELIVVVTIIGILASVAVPMYTGQTARARTKAALSDMKNIKAALELYYNDEQGGNGRYPLASNTDNYGIKNILEGRGIRWGSVRDPWGNPYRYSVDNATVPGSFRLESGGPDGVLGGGSTDDVVCGNAVGEPLAGQTAQALSGGSCLSGSGS